jgi:hypothetical protein
VEFVLDSDVDRQKLESSIRDSLTEYGIDARNLFLDRELKTVIVLCSHITDKMKIFMSKGNISLGGVARDSLVSAHRISVGGQPYGLMVIYCKECFDKGVKMLFEEG